MSRRYFRRPFDIACPDCHIIFILTIGGLFKCTTKRLWSCFYIWMHTDLKCSSHFNTSSLSCVGAWHTCVLSEGKWAERREMKCFVLEMQRGGFRFHLCWFISHAATISTAHMQICWQQLPFIKASVNTDMEPISQIVVANTPAVVYEKIFNSSRSNSRCRGCTSSCSSEWVVLIKRLDQDSLQRRGSWLMLPWSPDKTNWLDLSLHYLFGWRTSK